MRLNYQQLRYVATAGVSFSVGFIAFTLIWCLTEWMAEYVIIATLILSVAAAVIMFWITSSSVPKKPKKVKKTEKDYKVPFYTFPKE